MKNVLVFILISFLSKTVEAENVCLDTTRGNFSFFANDTISYPISTFSAVHWVFYQGRPINLLLQHLDEIFPGYILGKVYTNGNPRIANRLNIYYGDGIGIVITVNKFQYLNPFSEDCNWDVSTFCQENITQLELWDNDSCVYISDL